MILLKAKPIIEELKNQLLEERRLFSKKIGLALNPETGLAALEAYLDDLDQVLIMTVNPGYYGSKFLPEMLDKVRALRKLEPHINIEVDGGMDLVTIKQANSAGANKFVCGSYLQNAENVKEVYEKIMDELR